MGGIANTLDGVVRVTDALESGAVEILDFEVHVPEGDPDGGEVRLDLRLPDQNEENTDGDAGEQVFRVCMQPVDGDSNDDVTDADGRSKTTSNDRRDHDSGATESSSPDQFGDDEGEVKTGVRHDDAPASTRSDDADRGDQTDDSTDRIPCRHEDCDETFETERGMKIHFTKSHLEGASLNDEDESDRPAYADPAKLRRVYERYDTFEEMTDALEVDVTPATVRRHMIKYGIYDPAANDAERSTTDRGPSDHGSASDGESVPDRPRAEDAAAEGQKDGGHEDGDDSDDVASIEELVGPITDGDVSPSGLPEDDQLPEGVTVWTTVEAVLSARTLYEVANYLEVDRNTARDALERLNLLNLVGGRLANQPDRDERERQVAAKLEEMAAKAAPPSP
jgi:hypothetical protein